METKGLITTGIVAFIAYSLIRRQIGAGTLSFFPDRINSLRFDGLSPMLTFSMRVQNTSNQNFQINSFSAAVTSNSYVIGQASFFNSQMIPANSERLLRVDVRLMPLGIVQDLIRAFNDRNFTFNINIRGFANVSRLQIPVDLNYKVGL